MVLFFKGLPKKKQGLNSIVFILFIVSELLNVWNDFDDLFNRKVKCACHVVEFKIN